MTSLRNGILLIVLSAITLVVDAQSKKRLQPGKLYEPGEKIYAPRYGFTSVIPDGWEGTLPRDTEIFLLMPRTEIGGEIFTFASIQKDLASMSESWKKGVNLSETIIIKSSGEIKTDGDMISSEVVGSGEHVNKGGKGFVAAKCNPAGPCVTCIGLGPIQFFDQIKKAVESFMSTTTFSEPSNVSIYVDFNWNEFLTNKMLIAFMAIETTSGSGTKDNTFHLCKDGTFTAFIKKTGTMKQVNPKIKGRQSGTWSTESIGDNGILKLTFKNQPTVELRMLIKDEKSFINDERYFAAESDKCKD